DGSQEALNASQRDRTAEGDPLAIENDAVRGHRHRVQSVWIAAGRIRGKAGNRFFFVPCRGTRDDPVDDNSTTVTLRAVLSGTIKVPPHFEGSSARARGTDVHFYRVQRMWNPRPFQTRRVSQAEILMQTEISVVVGNPVQSAMSEQGWIGHRNILGD